MDSDTQLLQQLVAGQSRIEGKLDRLIGIFDDGAPLPDGEDTAVDTPLEPSDPK